MMANTRLVPRIRIQATNFRALDPEIFFGIKNSLINDYLTCMSSI